MAFASAPLQRAVRQPGVLRRPGQHTRRHRDLRARARAGAAHDPGRDRAGAPRGPRSEGVGPCRLHRASCGGDRAAVPRLDGRHGRGPHPRGLCCSASLLAYAYARVGAVRGALTVLSPLPLVVLGLFLLVSPVSELVLASGAEARAGSSDARSTPVVFIVFDELPDVVAHGTVEAPSTTRSTRTSPPSPGPPVGTATRQRSPT